MPPHDLREASFQNCNIQRTAPVHGEWFVIDGTIWSELRVQPQLLLRERQWRRSPGLALLDALSRNLVYPQLQVGFQLLALLIRDLHGFRHF
jgi:hypothetical protein